MITSVWFVWLLLASYLIPWTTAANSTSQQQQLQQTSPTRFFIDEGYFLDGDTEILRAYIAASNNRLEITGESTAAFLSVKGYYVPEKWDVYWTIRQSCHMAFPYMKPGQMVNCIPGVEAMSLKRRFIQTWQQAYGESAFSYIPRSYLLPEQYWLWRSYLLASGSPPDSKWVLKANVHRGKGVAVVQQTQALSQALVHRKVTSSSDGIEYHNVLIQQYCEPQMVIAGRSSYIRVWLLVTNLTPLRAYLFKGGFAIFGKQKGSVAAAAAAAANGTAAAGSSISTDDWIVNLWIQDRDKSPVWSLNQLEEYLDKHPEQVLPLPTGSSSSEGNTTGQQQQQRRTFADSWKDMQTSARLVLAAALPAMRAAAANSSAPDQGMFEYFGLDFVLDAYLKPWMLEVNAIPSMARRKRSSCTGSKATDNCQLNTAKPDSAPAAAAGAGSSSNAAAAEPDDFDQQKEHFVHDMLALLGLPVDAPTAAAAKAANPLGSRSSSNSSKGTVAAEGGGLDLLRRAAAAAAKAPTNSIASSSSSSAGRLLLQRRLSLRHNRKHQQQQVWLSSSSKKPDLVSSRVLQQDQQTTAQKIHRHHHRPSPAAMKAAAAAAAARTASSSAQPAGLAASVKDLPEAVQALLCASSSSSTSVHETFACTNCLTAADLAAVAAAQAELQRAGRFVPVYDLINAHNLNSLAAGHKGPSAEPHTSAAAGSSDGAAAVAPGAEYLSSDRSVWQKLYDTWKGVSSEGVGLRDLGIMKYYTTESQLAAARKLELTRQDYVMSAWLRVRQQQQQQEGCLSNSKDRLSEECVIKMLQQLVGECYMS